MFDTGFMSLATRSCLKALAAELNVELASSLITAEELEAQRPLAVPAPLAALVPRGGLARGSLVALDTARPGGFSLAIALVSEAVRNGAYLAVVADESFNLSICDDYQIPLERVVQFNLEEHGFAQALAAIIDGFDLVFLVKEPRLSSTITRRLIKRVRERESVLVRFARNPWASGADLELALGGCCWEGLGSGHGVLRRRRVEVTLAGRRSRGARQTFSLWLPGEEGGVSLAQGSSLVTAQLQDYLPQEGAAGVVRKVS